MFHVMASPYLTESVSIFLGRCSSYILNSRLYLEWVVSFVFVFSEVDPYRTGPTEGGRIPWSYTPTTPMQVHKNIKSKRTPTINLKKQTNVMERKTAKGPSFQESHV